MELKDLGKTGQGTFSPASHFCYSENYLAPGSHSTVRPSKGLLRSSSGEIVFPALRRLTQIPRIFRVLPSEDFPITNSKSPIAPTRSPEEARAFPRAPRGATSSGRTDTA